MPIKIRIDSIIAFITFHFYKSSDVLPPKHFGKMLIVRLFL
jgi:hypothetical protein